MWLAQFVWALKFLETPNRLCGHTVHDSYTSINEVVILEDTHRVSKGERGSVYWRLIANPKEEIKKMEAYCTQVWNILYYCSGGSS
jgi:hypothetical protein